MTDREQSARVLRLSGFFWGLDCRQRPRLQETMAALLKADEKIPDRELILQSIERTWRETRSPIAARERPDVADRPGAYGVRPPCAVAGRKGTRV
jgi:hypothetical protein